MTATADYAHVPAVNVNSNTRDVLAAIALVAAPTVLGIGLLVHPKEVTGEAEQLGIISRHASAWGTSHLLIYLGSVLMVGAVVALVRLADRHGAKGVLAAGVVAGFGAVALAATAATEMVTHHLVQAGTDAAAKAAMYHSYAKAGDLGTAVFLPDIALSIGIVALAFLLWRSRALKAWTAVAIGVGAVLAPLPVIALRDVGAVIFVLGMPGAAAATLRSSSPTLSGSC
jgi:hypothetical protein